MPFYGSNGQFGGGMSNPNFGGGGQGMPAFNPMLAGGNRVQPGGGGVQLPVAYPGTPPAFRNAQNNLYDLQQSALNANWSGDPHQQQLAQLALQRAQQQMQQQLGMYGALHNGNQVGASAMTPYRGRDPMASIMAAMMGGSMGGTPTGYMPSSATGNYTGL